MSFLEAYQQMKYGKTVSRLIEGHKILTVKIVYAQFYCVLDGNPTSIWPDDIDATDWEIINE